MTTDSQARYCPASAVEHNRQFIRVIPMDVKKWKAAKAGLVSLFVVVIAGYAIASGADPTTTGRLALLTLALVNGLELGELLAVWAEARAADDGEDV